MALSSAPYEPRILFFFLSHPHMIQVFGTCITSQYEGQEDGGGLVDHAFTASYAIRFRPSDPPESLSCTCGNVLRTPYHIITSCPLHYRDRVNSGIHSHNGTLSLRTLFSTRAGVTKLLSFLQVSGAASRPPYTGTIALARPNTPEGVG